MPTRTVSKEETQAVLHDSFDMENIAHEVREVAAWSDYQFTAEGRTFSFIMFGESILHCVLAKGNSVSTREQDWIREQAGVIVELDTDDPPMFYQDHDASAKAWSELKGSFGLPLTDEEQAVLYGLFPYDPDDD